MRVKIDSPQALDGKADLITAVLGHDQNLLARYGQNNWLGHGSCWIRLVLSFDKLGLGLGFGLLSCFCSSLLFVVFLLGFGKPLL